MGDNRGVVRLVIRDDVADGTVLLCQEDMGRAEPDGNGMANALGTCVLPVDEKTDGRPQVALDYLGDSKGVALWAGESDGKLCHGRENDWTKEPVSRW